MKPFKKILVPVDFSACSDEAVRRAADLAQRYDADLVLAHAFEPVPYMAQDGRQVLQPGQAEDLMASSAAALGQARRNAIIAGAPRVETRELQGGAAHEVVAFASAGHFDLVVIGTHGRTGKERMVLGSVAELVVRSAPCPVLCVRASQSPA